MYDKLFAESTRHSMITLGVAANDVMKRLKAIKTRRVELSDVRRFVLHIVQNLGTAYRLTPIRCPECPNKLCHPKFVASERRCRTYRRRHVRGLG